jgi:hypothetical protein
LLSAQAVNATHILAGKALVKGLASFLTELPGNNLTQGSGVASVPANFSIGASTGGPVQPLLSISCIVRHPAHEGFKANNQRML